jgi:uncharacterized protein
MLSEKEEKLRNIIGEIGSVLVAFSGGVDSSVLLAVACEALAGKVLAVTGDSETYPGSELEPARNLALRLGADHLVVQTCEMDTPGFVENSPQRCYHCKRELFSRLLDIARERGLAAVAEGSNSDDLGDYRPGRQAILELGVRSPLLEAGLSKTEVRALARKLGLEVADKPAAACLASRFPYGEPITVGKLSRVEAAEAYLGGLVEGHLRVRSHGDLARVEVEPDRMRVLIENRAEVAKTLRELGFTYVSLDLSGYRTGSMNEALGPGNRAGKVP